MREGKINLSFKKYMFCITKRFGESDMGPSQILATTRNYVESHLVSWPSLNGGSREGGPRGLWAWKLHIWNTLQVAESYLITEAIWKATKSQFSTCHQELLLTLMNHVQQKSALVIPPHSKVLSRLGF